MLERLREQQGARCSSIHGDRDLAVPLQTAKDAARRARGDLVVVQRRQPLVAPQGPRDAARRSCTPSCGAAWAPRCSRPSSTQGVDPVDATDDEVEAALYEPDALVLELTPRQRHHDTEDLHRPPRYRWKVLPARSAGD